eukprot:7442707-Alexandrium_andersonii.AAC.1
MAQVDGATPWACSEKVAGRKRPACAVARRRAFPAGVPGSAPYLPTWGAVVEPSLAFASMKTTSGSAWFARMRSLSANPSHQAATSALVVSGPGVGAWATTTSHAKRGQETVATSTRGSS